MHTIQPERIFDHLLSAVSSEAQPQNPPEGLDW